MAAGALTTAPAVADVVIAGGGIAGSTLAVLLGRAGVRVALFEERRFPREKPCGEGLMPAGVGVLRRMGLAEAAGGRPLHGVRYHGFGISAEADFPVVDGAPSLALGQRRLHLDRALFEAARATAGVEAAEGARVDGAVIEDGRAVGLRVDGAVVRGRLVVAADGPHSPVRRTLGLDAARPRRARLGLRMHFRLARPQEQASLIEIFIGDGHELYVTPLPGDEILVAGLADRRDTVGGGLQGVGDGGGEGGARAVLARWIQDEPVLRQRLAGAEPLTAVAGRSPLAHRARAGFAPGAVLLGDAAGFIDPVTAGGMAQALLTAELLAPLAQKALADGGARGDRWLARFDRQRRALLRDYHLLTRFVLFLVGRPRLARTMLKLMRRNPRLMAHLIGVAGGVRRLI